MCSPRDSISRSSASPGTSANMRLLPEPKQLVELCVSAFYERIGVMAKKVCARSLPLRPLFPKRILREHQRPVPEPAL